MSQKIYNNLGQICKGRLVYLRSTDIEQKNWHRLLWSFPDEALYHMSQNKTIIIRDLSTKRKGKIERIWAPVFIKILEDILKTQTTVFNRSLFHHYALARKALMKDKLLLKKYKFWKHRINKIRLHVITTRVKKEPNPLTFKKEVTI